MHFVPKFSGKRCFERTVKVQHTFKEYWVPLTANLAADKIKFVPPVSPPGGGIKIRHIS